MVTTLLHPKESIVSICSSLEVPEEILLASCSCSSIVYWTGRDSRPPRKCLDVLAALHVQCCQLWPRREWIRTFCYCIFWYRERSSIWRNFWKSYQSWAFIKIENAEVIPSRYLLEMTAAVTWDKVPPYLLLLKDLKSLLDSQTFKSLCFRILRG